MSGALLLTRLVSVNLLPEGAQLSQPVGPATQCERAAWRRPSRGEPIGQSRFGWPEPRLSRRGNGSGRSGRIWLAQRRLAWPFVALGRHFAQCAAIDCVRRATACARLAHSHLLPCVKVAHCKRKCVFSVSLCLLLVGSHEAGLPVRPSWRCCLGERARVRRQHSAGQDTRWKASGPQRSGRKVVVA